MPPLRFNAATASPLWEVYSHLLPLPGIVSLNAKPRGSGDAQTSPYALCKKVEKLVDQTGL